MLIPVKELRNLDVSARDGELGRLRELHFDDAAWVVRHFIISTSRWLGRDVLIAPEAVSAVDLEAERLELDLTRTQVENSPPVDLARPVSRQMAEAYYGHFGWPMYWGGAGYVGLGAPMVPVPRGRAVGTPPEEHEPPDGDPHLRSFEEVTGYHIRGRDGEIGHLEDLLVDDVGWRIRYLIVDTRNWWPGKKVLVLPQFVRELDWTQRIVAVDLRRDEIKQAPPFESDRPFTRADEERIHVHYGLPLYWTDGSAELRGP